jgi:DNA mismatch repair protein MutL
VDRLEVSDDGSGMEPDEALLAFERHATSKIVSEGDLLDVATFGFRGEALPSIASVSRVTLLTRPAGSPSGTRIRLEGGRLLEQSPAGIPVGTRVRVENLFFNTPARLKFLKTERTETSRLLDVLRHLALAHPRIGFSAARDGVEILACPPCDGPAERARLVFRRLALFGFREKQGSIEVTGQLTGPSSSRTGSAGLVFLVNGRPVVDRTLAGAVAAAHEGLLARGKYPQGVVHLVVPRRMVDVNVHPQKREVRFSDPRAVTGALYRAVSLWARTCPWAPGAAPLPSRVAEPASARLRHDESAPPLETAGTAAPESSLPLPALARSRFSSLEVVGQVLGTFIVCQGDDRVVFVDQHAAAERVAFERLRLAWRTGSVPGQLLLVPYRHDLDPARAALLEENEGLLGAFGLAVDLTGPESVAIREVPVILSGADPARLLDDVLGELEDARGRLDAVAEGVLAVMACHSSVRGGDELDAERVRALLSDLDDVDWAHHCPHGRPVSFEMTRGELERRLGRRG